MKTILDTLRDRLTEISRRISVVKNAPKPNQHDFLIDSGILQTLVDEQAFLAQVIRDLENNNL